MKIFLMKLEMNFLKFVLTILFVEEVCGLEEGGNRNESLVQARTRTFLGLE